MRVLRIEFYGDEPGRLLVPIDDLTLIIGKNGVGKSIALEAIEGLLNFWVELERRGRGDGDINLFGWLHVRLNVASGPTSDWPWFRKLLALGFPGDFGSDIPDLDWVLGGPERFEEPVFYEDELNSRQLTAEEDQSWDMFCGRAHDAWEPGEDPAMRQLATSLIGGEEIEVAVEMFPGGKIDLLLCPESDPECFATTRLIAPFVAQKSAPDSVARSIMERLSEPRATVVHTLHLGHSPGNMRDWGPLTDRFPRVIRMRDVIGDPEPTIDKAIDRTLSTMPSGHFRDEDRPHWVEDGPDGSARLRPEVLTIAERVSSRANHLLPPFISELGALSVTISPQSTWRDDIARSSVRFHFANGGGNAHFRMIGAGSRRWVAASLEAACDDLAIESTNASSLLYLIDEPEMHLHTLAQLEVLRWIEDRVAEGATAVLTTHSPLIFTTARESATLHALIRHGRDLTQVNMTESLLSDLGAIDGIADAVGTDRIAVLQVTRGLLAVEGEHDKMVIKRFFGPVLDRARIRLFPLRGHKNAMALAESELLTSLGIPLCVLFDDIREEALARRVEGSDLSGEEKEMIKLLDAMDRFRLQGLRIDGVPFSLPDVICAIPIQAIRRAFPRTRHDVAWDEVVAAWRGAARPRPGFKAFALKKLGLQNVEPDQFVERSLLAIQVVDRCASELEVAVKGSLAWLVGRPPGKS